MPSSYASKVVPGLKGIKVVPSENDLARGCRSLWIGDVLPGTLNITWLDGTESDDVPAHPGLFPFAVKKVRTGATTPLTNVWAVY